MGRIRYDDLAPGGAFVSTGVVRLNNQQPRIFTMRSGSRLQCKPLHASNFTKALFQAIH